MIAPGLIFIIGYTLVVFCIGVVAGFLAGKHFRLADLVDKREVQKPANGAQSDQKHKSAFEHKNNHQQKNASNVEDTSSEQKTEEKQSQKSKFLSKKELRKIERNQEKARKREEAQKLHEEVELERKRKAFNPRILKPENVAYSNLAVSDGKLIPCALGQTSYYHYWEFEGKRFFEFYCEPSKVAKAVNNRSAIIDPFCQKDSDSVSVDQSKSIEIIEFGELDEKFNIISKSIISYR